MLKKTTSSISEVLLTTKWVLSTYLKIAPKLTIVYFITQGIVRLEGIIYAYFFGRILDQIIQTAGRGTATIQEFIPITLILIGIRFIFAMLNALSNNTYRVIQLKDIFILRIILYQRLRELGIASLEDPEVTNRAQRFTELSGSINDYLRVIVRIFSGIVSLIAATGVILASSPGVLPIFLVAVAISWMIDQRYVRLLATHNISSTESRRKASSSAGDLSNSTSLKELIATDGFHYLHQKYEGFVNWHVGVVTRIRKNWVTMQIFSNGVELIAYAIGMMVIFQKLLQGLITIGKLTFELRSLAIFAENLSTTALDLVSLREHSIRLSDALGLYYLYQTDADGKKPFSSLINPPAIHFNNIQFGYKTSPKPIFKDLNLTIQPGEKIAIVGENGAGKTTLVKLLLRIYRPQKGEVLLNEENINELQIASWYKNVGVLFQDFNTYQHMTVRENIGIGDIKKNFSKKKIIDALKRADAFEFVEKYPQKLEQLLGEKFKGGIRPSTGQWQKIAIARFFYRDAPVLIFDEPTASIDAVSEAEIFDNIYKFIKNKTVIIISHRFSTVRNADRILVLDKGKIIEEGSHEELLKKRGKYAKAFRLQAKGYE